MSCVDPTIEANHGMNILHFAVSKWKDCRKGVLEILLKEKTRYVRQADLLFSNHRLTQISNSIATEGGIPSRLCNCSARLVHHYSLLGIAYKD